MSVLYCFLKTEVVFSYPKCFLVAYRLSWCRIMQAPSLSWFFFQSGMFWLFCETSYWFWCFRVRAWRKQSTIYILYLLFFLYFIFYIIVSKAIRLERWKISSKIQNIYLCQQPNHFYVIKHPNIFKEGMTKILILSPSYTYS